jgi:predicted anti-sigma-YlaC factor YlaD
MANITSWELRKLAAYLDGQREDLGYPFLGDHLEVCEAHLSVNGATGEVDATLLVVTDEDGDIEERKVEL